MKHIESIQPELAAFELDRIGREETDATASAALTALLHSVTGCDIPQTSDLPESEVEELVPLCVSILRRHWQTPLTCLGDGITPMSMSDLLRRLIGDRVQGNEAWCIPPVHGTIPTAVAALRERKIGGVPEAPDGLSLPRLLCDSTIADTITELIDDNIGWVMTKAITAFPNLEKLDLNCKEILMVYPSTQINFTLAKTKTLHLPFVQSIQPGSDSSSLPTYNAIFNGSPLEDVDLSELQSYTGRLFVGGSLPEELNLPKLTNAGTCIAQSCAKVKRIIAENVTTCTGYSYHPNLISNCPDLEYAYIPNLAAYTVYGSGDGAGSLQDMPKLSHLVIGKVPFTNSSTYWRFALDNCPNLVLLDIRGNLNQSIYLDHWNPTDKGSLFLSNFRLYIADRLSDNGSGKTLTLSQEVRDAIHSAGIDTIITNKGWTISPVPTQQ